MKLDRKARLVPNWLASYAGIILLVGVFVNLATGFAQSTHSLTIPSMRVDFGISYIQAGLLMTVFAAVRMASALAAGTLAPRYGSRYIIGVGTVITGGAMLLLGYSPNYMVALVSAALMGVGSGASLTPMMGLLAPWFAMQNRGMAAGVVASGTSIAIVVGGLVIPQLIDQNPAEGWRHTWYIFGAFVLVIGIVSIVFLRDQPEDPAGSIGPSQRLVSRGAWPLAVFKNPLVWMLTYLAFCSGTAHSVFTTFFGAYLIDENSVSLATAGRLLLLVGVLSVIGSILWGKVSDRLGRGQAFALSFLIHAAGFALFWLSPVMAAFVVASALVGLTLQAAFTLCAAASGDHVAARFAATAFAMMSVGAGLGSTASPIIAGAIADTVGISWVFALGFGASLMGAAGAVFLSISRASPQPAAAGPGD